MATAAQADAHRRAVADLVALAMRDLVAFWQAVDLADPVAVSAALQQLMPDLVTAYAAAAAGVTADWYDDLREQAGAPGRYRAVPAPAPPPEKAQVLARWAVGPLFGAHPDPQVALSKTAGGLQRAVAGGSRGTVEANVARDPGRPRYARAAAAGACAFCRMLATRGPVYWSQDTAGGNYHDACHCVAVPVWDTEAYEPPSHVQRWQEDYAAARAEAGRDTKSILAAMRRATGAH